MVLVGREGLEPPPRSFSSFRSTVRAIGPEKFLQRYLTSKFFRCLCHWANPAGIVLVPDERFELPLYPLTRDEMLCLAAEGEI